MPASTFARNCRTVLAVLSMVWTAACCLASKAVAAPFPMPPMGAALVTPTPPVSPPPAFSPGLPDQYRTLAPIRDPFLSIWQRATAVDMAGPSASPYFRELSTRLDVTWRLAELSPQPVQLPTETRDLALDQCIAGATMGWNSAIRQVFQRTPEMAAAHLFLKSTVNPGVKVSKGSSGNRHLAAEDPGTRNQRAAFADIQQGPTTRDIPSGIRFPTISSGGALTLVNLPGSASLSASENTDSPFSPAIATWIDIRNAGVDAARVQARVGAPRTLQRMRPDIRYAALARKSLTPQWALIVDIQGRPDVPRPLSTGGAIEHRLAWLNHPEWAIRAARTESLRDDLGPDVYEQRLDLTLRTTLAWRLPQDVRHWPLGQRPGAPGPTLPMLPQNGPGPWTPMATTPAERTGAGPAPTVRVAQY